MEIKIVDREKFYVCGWAVETTPEKNDQDISRLYKTFFEEKKDETLLAHKGCQKGYYGLSWYTFEHERYCYLLGRETEESFSAPEGALLKAVPFATYAVARVPDGMDIKEAWTVFFYDDIPQQGFAPNEEHGFYFEYYPESVHGKCELWVPVIRKI